MRVDAPVAMRRRGPRPLALHLMLADGMPPAEALLRWQTSAAGSLNWSAAWPGLGDAALIRGIAAYRRHPWHRELPDPPTLWEEGGSRLLSFAPNNASDGEPVLFVPSLVNRATVLDLMPGHSMLRWLAGQGVRPLLLDWGWPGEVERGFSLTDYVAGRLERVLAAIGRPVTLVGYCMGGLLALAAAQRNPGTVSRLALLATPWDFHGAGGDAVSRALPALEPLLSLTGALPVDAIQGLFTLLDPGGVARKYRHFGTLDQASAEAARFVAIEDWLNDGVPLAAPVARDCLAGWYGQNQPTAGTWRIAGQVVDSRTIAAPCFLAIPSRDRIVPPESALPLAALLPNVTVHRPASGHVGMVTGSQARDALWQPLLDWLQDRKLP